MRYLRLLLVTAAIGALSACASLSPAKTEMPTAATDVPASWLLELPTDGNQPVDWADLYDDPILLRYLTVADAQNFDIRTAQKRVIGAEAELRRASSRLKPTLDAGGSASATALFSDIDDPFDSYGLDVSGRWNPDIFGQTRAAIDNSRANLRAQEALAADTRQAVLGATGRAYVRAVEAALQVDLAKTNLDFLAESRRISEARYRLGDTAKGDFSFAEANYQSALASYESTVQSARAARRALSIILGDYPDEDIELATELREPSALPPRDIPASMLARRPDIVAARAQLAGRVASLQGAKLERWPSLSFSGSLSSGSDFTDLFDPSDFVARLGASIAQNIFSGGAIRAGVDSAQANLDISLLTYEQRLRSAMNDISNAYDRAETLRRTLVNLESSSEAANEALRLESIQFDLGESSLLDVLQVQTRVNSIDASLIRTKADLLESVLTANEAVAGF